MRRAAISVVSNIAEGFERRSPRSFSHFLLIAKGSIAELRTQLYLCADRKYLAPSLAASLNDQAAEISRMLCGLISYLNQPQCQRGTRNVERGTT
jgi:four helix bundle protein